MRHALPCAIALREHTNARARLTALCPRLSCRKVVVQRDLSKEEKHRVKQRCEAAEAEQKAMPRCDVLALPQHTRGRAHSTPRDV
jgi:hypothetical protein